MSETFLDKVVAKAREKVRILKQGANSAELRSHVEKVRSATKPHGFRTALERTDRTNIIAEIKRASPSKGVINAEINVAEVARSYELGGAAAISVLTESEFFGGSLADLLTVMQHAQIPTLRKDFIVDEYQIYEAAVFGADAVLLIVAALSENELLRLRRITEDGLGMDALIEVHTSDELEIAKRIGANIIGVNNRDLQSLKVSLDVSRRLIHERPADALMIAESGISNRIEIDELKKLGFDGFLIGETLMRSTDVAETLRRLSE